MSRTAASADAVLLTAAQALSRSAAIGSWLRDRIPSAREAGSPAERLVLAVDAYHPATAADLICAVYGALRHGVIPVLLDHGSGETELADLTRDAAPIAAISTADALREALSGPAPGDVSPVPRGRPMHYTSGTTGRRKGVFSDVLARDQAIALWREEQSLWQLTSDDVQIVMSPLHHSAPLRFALVTLLAGGSVLLPGRFTVDSWLAASRAYRPTATFTAPAQLQHLRARALDSDAGRSAVQAALGGLRLLTHAGAACPEPVKRWLLDQVPPERVWEFYGSTEGQFTACSGPEWLARPGSVGRARPGRTLDIGADGRIWCTVPEFARFSYWNAPDKTAAAWRATPGGPAFTVGDAGHLDDDGYLYLHGRRDDLIISGGVNVYPAEVERVLAGLPGVDEVVVFGVEDERWGQRVEAAVIGTADPETLLRAAARELPAARRPKRVHLVEDLPRTSTGKIRRRDLPELLG